MPVSEAAAAMTVLSQARTLLRALRQSVLSAQHQTIIDQALEVVADGQERLSAMQANIIELQQENHGLQERIRLADDWNSRRARYSLEQTPGGALLLAAEEPFRHYACPKCAETDRELHVLQPPHSDYLGSFSCPKCDSSFKARPSKPAPDPYSGFRNR